MGSSAYRKGGNEIDTSGLALKSEIPTKVSQLMNDSGYIKDYIESDPYFNASAAASITQNDINNWNNKSNFSGNYADLNNKPIIPSIEGLASKDYVTRAMAAKVIYELMTIRGAQQ